MGEKRILVVDDEKDQRELLAGFLSKRGFSVTTASNGEEALSLYNANLSPVAIVDMKMPGMNGLELIQKLKDVNPFIQIIMLTAFGSVETAVSAMRAGACDYVTKPVENLEELILKIEKAVAQNRLVVDHQIMSERLAEVFPQTEIIGDSLSIQKVKEMISLVAPQEATVLITGASGTGKELVARAIHALSKRADKKLVAINCAAFPETLLEAELFGYERGAFTGADRSKQGRFELAEGGTLFLDEIAEMPITMQVKLLRVLEDHKIQRLGSLKEISLDIRLVAATNRDLDKLISDGQFREDLYYRLNVIRIHLPSLAERKSDILILAKKFLEKFSRRIGKEVIGFDSPAASALINYSWPGNVRELENMIERAVVLTSSNVISESCLSGLTIKVNPIGDGEIKPLHEIEKEHIFNCLSKYNWNIGESAQVLGIHRNTLRMKIKEYGLINPQ